jgi:phosphohistidine phosphatase
MQLLVIRHAAAGEREDWARTGKSDDLRPLTDEGRREMRDATAGLRKVVKQIAVLATSPLVRAVQTADIVAESYDARRVTTEVLRPDASFDAFARWAREHRDADGAVAIVGHEPHLSELVSWLLAGSKDSFLDLKKGAACLLDIDGAPGPRTGTLRWALTPKHLRALG